MNGAGRHLATIIPLLSLLALGCCRDIPSDQLAKYPPLTNPSRIDGVYAGRAPAENRPDLWEILTGRTVEDRPGQVRQIRVRAVAEDSINVVRYMNGVQVEQQDVPCKFEGGYIRLNRSLFRSNVELTDIGCLQIAIAAGRNDNEIAIYCDESIGAFWCLLIPVPADPVPRWDVFGKVALIIPSK